MVSTPEAEPVPLAMDVDGVFRVGGTRVTLDLIVTAFNMGATPNEIVEQFPTVKLADVYAVIAYYLRHQADVDDYLRQREQEADQLQREVEARFDPVGVRERLETRLAGKKRKS